MLMSIKKLLQKIKSKFKKEEEVEEYIPKPDKFAIALANWAFTLTELPSLTREVKIENGEKSIIYKFAFEDKRLTIGANSYVHKKLSDPTAEENKTVYMLYAIDMFNKHIGEWCTIGIKYIFNFNINEDNAPYMKSIFEKVDSIYHTSDEYKAARQELNKNEKEAEEFINKVITDYIK